MLGPFGFGFNDMKHSLLTCAALGASFLIAGYALGQTKAGSTAATASPAVAPAATKLIKVATLSTVEANRDFAKNVQLIQAQRQMAVELNGAWEKEKDAKKKGELKTQLDALLAKLNENNAAMSKAYGFSLTRNYTMEIETAHIYMQVTEEEAARFEQEQKAAAQKDAKAAPKKAKK